MEKLDDARRSTRLRMTTTRTTRVIRASRLGVKTVLKRMAIYLLMHTSIYMLMQETTGAKDVNIGAGSRA
eukprot:6434088-Prymnesium_polylepis.1